MTRKRGLSIVGWAAILSGVLNLVGFIFLMLFFALEAPQVLQRGEPDTPPLFGTLNDASFIFVALLLVPVALDLHQRAKVHAPTWSRISLVIGLGSLLGIAAVQVLYVPRVISTALQAPLITIGLGAMGLWLLLVNWLGQREAVVSKRLSWLEMAIGVCLLLMPVAYFAADGPASANALGTGTVSPFVIVGFGLAMLGLGIGFPVWAILVGRRFLRRDEGISHPV